MTTQTHTMSVKVIGAATGLGAPDSHCADAPKAMWHGTENDFVEWGDIVSPVAEGSVAEQIKTFSEALSNAVAEHYSTEQRLIVIGGDHSCAMGTWRGVTQHVKRLGLIWIDAHMDAHTQHSSPSGCWHGMPVANLLGCEGALMAGDTAVILADNLTLIGVRSYEPEEAALMARLGVKVFTIDDVHRLGFDMVMKQARERACDGTDGYGISIDLDGLDLADAPGVGSPVVGGISASEMNDALAMMRIDEQLAALEIVEFNPVVDVENRTKKLLLTFIETMTGVAAS